MQHIVRLGLIAPLVSLMVAASAQQTITYTVKSGDSLYTIAHRHGLRLPELLAANNLRNPHALQIGDKIKIPVKGKARSTAAKSTARSNAPATGWAEINKDRINIRRAPSISARRVAIVDRWTKAQVLGREGDWRRVRLQNGRTGWVLGQYLSPTKPPQTKQVASNTSTRKRQAKQSSAARPKVASRNPSRAQAAASAASGESPSVVRRALGYLGSRYSYGGSSARGFDCSGFTAYIYRQHGIYLPHNSAAQYRVGKPVSRSELRPGDLVFFRTRGRRISHVGIYMGDGKFVHASSARGRVRIDTLNSGYYHQRYVGARRVAK
ncbi:MAG: NlpC/P60 family protein [Fimbriimonadales bacterium]|nr:NlpC/P60 family protein [Fimbriimonadales bacterium]